MSGSRRLLWLLAAGLALALAFWLDPRIWRTVVYLPVYEHDWGRVLRVMGSLFFWIPVTLAVGLQRRGKSWLLALGPALAGGLAEVLKLLVRRERPLLHAGAYQFRPFAERPFDTHDLGFPSSHAAVAFAGAAMLARLYPRAAPVFYLLALGCALSRVLSQAHFASDVVAGGIAGWAVGSWLGRRVGSIPILEGTA